MYNLFFLNIISNGPTYEILVQGRGLSPRLGLSFTSKDFGPCFVHRAGMPVTTATLELKNNDSKEMTVNCLFAPTQYLSVDFKPAVLAPNESANAILSFIPREAKHYKETVEFEVSDTLCVCALPRTGPSMDFHGLIVLKTVVVLTQARLRNA